MVSLALQLGGIVMVYNVIASSLSCGTLGVRSATPFTISKFLDALITNLSIRAR